MSSSIPTPVDSVRPGWPLAALAVLAIAFTLISSGYRIWRSLGALPLPDRREARLRAERFLVINLDVSVPVDLVSKVDPLLDVVRGNWRLEAGSLVGGSKGSSALLQLPCIAPSSYDLDILVERRSSTGAVILGLTMAGRAFTVFLDATSPSGPCSSVSLQGPGIDAAPVHPGPVLRERAPLLVQCRVRGRSLQILADGRPILDWNGKPAALVVSKPWEVPNSQALFLGVEGSETAFGKVILRPVLEQVPGRR
jgi:hypothetical protein